MTSCVPDDLALLISGFDPANRGRGGLFTWAGGDVTGLDTHDTTGLRRNGDGLLRCLWAAEDERGHLVKISQDGHASLVPPARVGDPHDVIADGEFTVVVATAQNQVVWLDHGGKPARVWQPGPEPDSWHLNSLVRHEGRLLVSAFGQFSKRKEWELLGRPASGCVLDIETGTTVLGGLLAPHTPRYVGGQWMICNSGTAEVLVIDAAGNRCTLARLDGWTRGLAITESVIFVGVSPPRHAENSVDALSRVAVLSRSCGAVLAEVTVPVREIYDLALVPKAMLPALRTACDQLGATLLERAER